MFIHTLQNGPIQNITDASLHITIMFVLRTLSINSFVFFYSAVYHHLQQLSFWTLYPLNLFFSVLAIACHWWASLTMLSSVTHHCILIFYEVDFLKFYIWMRPCGISLHCRLTLQSTMSSKLTSTIVMMVFFMAG